MGLLPHSGGATQSVDRLIRQRHKITTGLALAELQWDTEGL
jgi:hypothetical protein